MAVLEERPSRRRVRLADRESTQRKGRGHSEPS